MSEPPAVEATPSPLHAGRVPPNKGKKYPAEIPTPDEFRAILAQIPTHTWLGRRNRTLITVLFRAGLRISEGLSLRPTTSISSPASSRCFTAKATSAAPLESMPVRV